MEEVNKVFGFLNVDCEISDLRRLGSYEEAKTSGKNRPIIVDLANPWQKRIIFLSLYKLKGYGKPVYISRELNPDEITIENELLKQRRDLINKGTPAKDLRVNNLKLLRRDGLKWNPYTPTPTRNQENLSC